MTDKPGREPRSAPRTSPNSYWRLASTHRYSLLFALPLFLLYEGLAALRSGDLVSGVRNGADVLLKQVLLLVHPHYGPLLLGAILVGISTWLIAMDMKRSRDRLRPRIFAGMLAESVVLALMFGAVVSMVTSTVLEALQLSTRLQVEMGSQVQPLDKATELTISLGAGLYEELVFRVILTSGLAAGARILLGVRMVTAGVFATIVSALVFSAFHYVGPYGDPLELTSFTFRAIAGLFFSAMYLTRGFGITAWTHALYDVFLISLR
jgi:hypothetical protein